jgi:hypothetical protein
MWLQSPLALDAELSREEADGGPLGSTNSSEACQASHSPRQQPERIAYSSMHRKCESAAVSMPLYLGMSERSRRPSEIHREFLQ